MNQSDEDDLAVPSDQHAAEAQLSGKGVARPSDDARAAAGATDVQTYIGRQLRAVYEDVAKQPIPERFLALMRQLEEQPPRK